MLKYGVEEFINSFALILFLLQVFGNLEARM
jgi:hypothetical protein